MENHEALWKIEPQSNYISKSKYSKIKVGQGNGRTWGFFLWNVICQMIILLIVEKCKDQMKVDSYIRQTINLIPLTRGKGWFLQAGWNPKTNRWWSPSNTVKFLLIQARMICSGTPTWLTQSSKKKVSSLLSSEQPPLEPAKFTPLIPPTLPTNGW